MYGLVEYALLRQQLNEGKMKSKHHHEFDFPVTQPAMKRRRRLHNVKNYISRKIGFSRKIK